MSLTFHPAYQDDQETWRIVESIEGLNVCNRNACDLVHALGLSIDEGFLEPVPIVELINRCTGFLRRRIGRPDPAIAAREVGVEGGPVLIEGGRGEGYLQLKVMQLLEVARAGQVQGATHVYAA